MFKVNGIEKEIILDMNLLYSGKISLHVVSKGKNGNYLPWGIELVSCNLLTATTSSYDYLDVAYDRDNIDESCFILLGNYNKERFKISVVPKKQPLTSAELDLYKFKITKKTTEGKKTRIKILSKGMDNEEIGWKCTYDGKPLNYSISPMESDKSDYVDIELTDEVYTDVDSVIEFTQDTTGKMISLPLHNEKAD